MISEDKFYEYAKIFENYYGTLKDDVDKIIKKNDLLFDIDWQGTKKLSKFKHFKFTQKFFLVAENKKRIKKKRLIKRNQNTDKEIEKRFNSFDGDVQHWNDYDYILINKNLEVCFKQIEDIIKSKKLISSSSLKS